MVELDIYAILFPECYTFKDCEKWMNKMRPNDDILYYSFVTILGIEYINTLYLKQKIIPDNYITAFLFDGVEIAYILL